MDIFVQFTTDDDRVRITRSWAYEPNYLYDRFEFQRDKANVQTPEDVESNGCLPFRLITLLNLPVSSGYVHVRHSLSRTAALTPTSSYATSASAAMEVSSAPSSSCVD
jgi:hypothetical protein